jgi:hypothetical protein
MSTSGTVNPKSQFSSEAGGQNNATGTSKQFNGARFYAPVYIDSSREEYLGKKRELPEGKSAAG